MIEFLESVNAFLWSVPLLVLILLVGLGLSFSTGFLQLRKLPTAFRCLVQSIQKNKDESNGISSYRALCTALAATVGTGNLAGVAGAIALGGPGAVFWMWVSGILGMIIKFAEVVLAVRFRDKDGKGNWIGGPMYVIKNGLPKRLHFMASLYSFLGVVAVFGVGNTTQVNAVVGAANSVLSRSGYSLGCIGSVILGVLLAAWILHAFLHEGNGIGRMTQKLVPVAAVLYILISFGALILNATKIPTAIASIFVGAFTPKAVTGGVVGSVVIALRTGTARGVFTNEAGMGTASIAHAESSATDPIQQGLMGIMEVFIDTIVICTLTALVILCSGVSMPYGTDPGIALTIDAFSSVLGEWISLVLSFIICLLAIATILGWGLYGLRCAQFLFGEGIYKRFALIQAAAVIIGAVMNTSTVWLLSELVNGLMAIPNLIALTWLLPEFHKIIKAYRC